MFLDTVETSKDEHVHFTNKLEVPQLNFMLCLFSRAATWYTQRGKLDLGVGRVQLVVLYYFQADFR